MKGYGKGKPGYTTPRGTKPWKKRTLYRELMAGVLAMRDRRLDMTPTDAVDELTRDAQDLEIYDPADVLPGVGKTGALIVPDATGHAKYEWDKEDPADVEEMRKIFNQKKALGFSAYRIDPKTGDKGSIIKEFDPTAERVILVPPMAGG
jgi:hypothetical protein